MLFGFDVKISDKDYLDFNSFVILRSPYGKKSRLINRILIAVLIVIATLSVAFFSGRHYCVDNLFYPLRDLCGAFSGIF